MKKGVTVRRAVPTDLEWIVAQAFEFSKFYNTKSIPFNFTYANFYFTNLITTQIVFVAEKSGELMGFIAGYLVPHHFNPNLRMLAEAFWWVEEKHRGSRAALSLLNEFVAFGKANADLITMSLEENSPASDRSFTKRGFKPKERAYMLEVS